MGDDVRLNQTIVYSVGIVSDSDLGVVNNLRGPVISHHGLVLPATDPDYVSRLHDLGQLETRQTAASTGSDDEESASLGQLPVVPETLQGGEVGHRQGGGLGERELGRLLGYRIGISHHNFCKAALQISGIIPNF